MTRSKDNTYHHYVQKAYLEGFYKNKKELLTSYDKSLNRYRIKKGARKILGIDHYFLQDSVPDGVDNLILEKEGFAANVEPKGLNALKKLINPLETLSDEDMANICIYIAVHRIRVPRQADMAKLLAETTLTTEIMKTPKGQKALEYTKVVIKNSFRFEFMRIALGCFSPYFSRMVWLVVEAAHDASFITSDSPATFYNVDFLSPAEPGIGLYGTSVLFPINKQFLLVMVYPEYLSGEKTASEALPRDLSTEDSVIEIRRLIWDKQQVTRQNKRMFQLSYNVIVGESKAVLEDAMNA